MRTHWGLLVVLISVLAACGNRGDRVARENMGGVETRLPSPTSSVEATHTATSSPTHTRAPSPTGTSTPTNTARVTATPSPSRTPTDTPTPTETPTPTDTPTPAPPTPTPLPPPTPTPSVDFRVASWRLWPLELNSGCEKGMHNIFIIVQDANGAPLDGVVVGDTWNNVEEISGRKGPGRTEINLWANAMEITVKRDGATGEPYTSEVSPPSGSFFTDIPNEQLDEAGYCANVDHCQWMKENDPWHCGGHYSWEIIFQRTY